MSQTIEYLLIVDLCPSMQLTDIHKAQRIHIHFHLADIPVSTVYTAARFNSAHWPVLNQASCQYQSELGSLAQGRSQREAQHRSTIHDNTGLSKPLPLTAGLLCAVPLMPPCFPLLGQFNN